MSGLTHPELSSIDASLKENPELRFVVETQMRQAIVVSRRSTGGGFLTNISITGLEPLEQKNLHLGNGVSIRIEGLDWGLGMILHFEDGFANLLEGYAIAPENTSSIDFEQVHFQVADKPGAFPIGGS